MTVSEQRPLSLDPPEQAPHCSKPGELGAISHPRWPWVVGLGLLLSGGLGWLALRPVDLSPSPSDGSSPPARAVETAPLESGSGQQNRQLLGQIEARTVAEFRSRATGVVQQLRVQAGDAVEAGAIIAVLDDIDQRLALARAEAELAQARQALVELERGTRPEILQQRQAGVRLAQTLEQEALDSLARTQALVTEGALSRRVLIEAQAGADSSEARRLEAEAALAEVIAGPRQEEIAAQQAVVRAQEIAVEQARVALERTQIQAPAAGIVQERWASVGDFLEVGDPVVSIVDRQTLDVFLEVPETLGGQVVAGLPVTLTTRAIPDWQITAPITAVIPTADRVSRRQQVRVSLADPHPELLPGMAVQAQLTGLETPGWLISRDALTRRGGSWNIFVVEEDTAQQIPVELAADMGETVAITSTALQEGQQVVVRGSEVLQTGTSVQIIN